MDPLTLLIAIIAAGAGALSTYVANRIEAAQTRRDMRELRRQRERDRKAIDFLLLMQADVCNKIGIPERYSTGIMRVMSFTPTEASDGQHEPD